jgi:hypothetical protein
MTQFKDGCFVRCKNFPKYGVGIIIEIISDIAMIKLSNQSVIHQHIANLERSNSESYIMCLRKNLDKIKNKSTSTSHEEKVKRSTIKLIEIELKVYDKN